MFRSFGIRSTVARGGALVLLLATATLRLGAQLPGKLTDAEFWKMITDFSEPAGYFPSENFTSNETGFQTVLPELKKTTAPGGVYMGVGPEQNFTYIVALQPKMAFITDIRRQNLIQHLVYKVLMEQFDNRVDFISHLFSVSRPSGLDSNSTAIAIFDAFDGAKGDSGLRDQNVALVLDKLTKQHQFVLSDSDISMVNHVLTAFYQAGTRINYGFRVGGSNGAVVTQIKNVDTTGGGQSLQTTGMSFSITGSFSMSSPVNYASLMTATDGVGVNQSYLANEAGYRWLRDLEMRNMVVPLVGDFGGNKALRAVGTYLKAHQAIVTTFYCSNVEQYLFPSPSGARLAVGGTGWAEFYGSVAALPLDSSSTFIRSGGGGGSSMASSVLASMKATVTAFKAGLINSRQDVLNLSHEPIQ